MFEENPALRTPPDTTVIWRFTDLPRFLNLLVSESLWFSHPHYFQDPWDSVCSEQETTDIGISLSKGSEPRSMDPRNREGLRALNQRPLLTSPCGACCWYGRDQESEAFWRVYEHQKWAIAIKSSIVRAKKALNADTETSRTENTSSGTFDVPMGVMIGKVLYDGPATQFLKAGTDSIFRPMISKRPAFRWEEEVRFITMFRYRTDAPTISRLGQDVPIGEARPVWINELIDEVVIAPTAPDWFVDDVRKLVKKLEFQFPVGKSQLLMPPA